MNIEKCLPGVYPKDKIEEKAPTSERKVFEALNKALTKEWYA
jgi:hypothetical protein